MKHHAIKTLAVLTALLLASSSVRAGESVGMPSGQEANRYVAEVIDGDTIIRVFLHEIYVFPPMKFTSKKQEKFYWRTVRDVKKTLPYAKLIAKEVERTSHELEQFSTKKEKRQYINTYEKGLLNQYKPAMKKMSARQGQMLMKLVDRECHVTSYEVIKLYKGAVSAFFWQSLAVLFGNDLKAEYDGKDADQITERIILLVEAGQL
ncbi:MAG: DUF4294 domain-containing protein [Paludibacteraceae bacterium]|nr:DUF4294 domain-containing protein [Paludibacteraceae bacterium]